jgi:hypothetical protein
VKIALQNNVCVKRNCPCFVPYKVQMFCKK